ncbi:hypothetical protein PT286_09705 [Neisseriaceae bacterium ESL0693]|nr:hypothetical protein [Neisseriaceae bacterium ESL0693]
MDILIIIPLLVVLLVVLLVLKKRQGSAGVSKKRKASRQKPKKANVESKDASQTDAAKQNSSAAEEEEEWDWQSQPSDKATVSVASVDHLTEFKVYKQFGYFQKAADSLSAYLSANIKGQAAEATQILVRELADLCLAAKNQDQLATVIDHYRTYLDKSTLQELIRQGLVIDANHLGLRVLAEDLLHWDVHETDKEIGVEDKLPPEPETNTKLSPAAQKDKEIKSKRKLLIEGNVGYFQVHGDERDVLLSFSKPEKSYALLKDQLPYEAALRCLNRAIETSNKPASLIIDALALDYRYKNINVFAQHLWRLYYTLGQYGNLVKERMLGWGYNMGVHPMFDELESKPNEKILRDIGVTQGYLPMNSSALKARRLPLVEDAQNNTNTPETPIDHILRDSESLLTFGQLDQALDLLEESVLKYPQESQLYITLFDLYERAEEWTRLQKMLQIIRTKIKTPPEEVALAMSQLLKRINHDGVQNQ